MNRTQHREPTKSKAKHTSIAISSSSASTMAKYASKNRRATAFLSWRPIGADKPRRATHASGIAAMLLLCACSTTLLEAPQNPRSGEHMRPLAGDGHMAVPSAEHAKETVDHVIRALRKGDSVAFQDTLSSRLRAAYGPEYFSLWKAEVERYSTIETSTVRLDPKRQIAQVSVILQGTASVTTAVRLVWEQGAWRWDER